MNEEYERRPDPLEPTGQEPEPIPVQPDTPPPPPAYTPPPPQELRATGIACINCGYNLTGIAIGNSCPECGTPVNESMIATGRPPSGLAIAAMVLGIVSTVSAVFGCMCFGPFIGLPTGIAGLICWQFARNPIREGRVSPGSNGMNIAGLTTSLVGLALSLVWAALLAYAIIVEN